MLKIRYAFLIKHFFFIDNLILKKMLRKRRISFFEKWIAENFFSVTKKSQKTTKENRKNFSKFA